MVIWNIYSSPDGKSGWDESSVLFFFTHFFVAFSQPSIQRKPTFFPLKPTRKR